VDYAATKGVKAISIAGDLTKEADANAMVEKTVEAFGGLNVLINNAGSLVARRMLDEMDANFWHKVMDINLTSMMFATRAAAPHLGKNDSASIVNLASLAGRKGGHPGSLVYSTSKGAIAGIPILRAGNVDDVARAVLYLASEYDGFITGATLDINGGVYNM